MMMVRLIGAAMTLFSGALYAVTVTKEHRQKEGNLEELQMILEHFIWELQTNLSPLSICCRESASSGRGQIAMIFMDLATYLEESCAPTPADCMVKALAEQNLPSILHTRLLQLADNLGRYDLSGQIGGIRAIQELCRRDLQALAKERTKTVKSCQALGLCTGAAIAILLL